jgi:enoyl-[acyl-carrier protein] reductase II
MKTRITELFNIKYPILLSGMSWISTPPMVAAVSNAGGLGILATGPYSADGTRNAIWEIRSLTDRPFGANASLLLPSATENAAVLVEEEVPVINFSLGKGDWLVKAAHRYGGKVIATVVNGTHAKRAEEYGSDGLIVTGHEAAAHGGDVTSLVLIPSIADSINIPIIAAGGFADGRGLAAALALGAEGIAMGTRFMMTQESPLHFAYKELSIKKSVYDTLYSDQIDGLPCRILDTEAARTAVTRGLDVLAALKNSRRIANQLELPYMKLLVAVISSGIKKSIQLARLANGSERIRLATEDGDSQRGVLPAGQVTGLINDIPFVSELMEKMVDQAEIIQKKMTAQLSRN